MRWEGLYLSCDLEKAWVVFHANGSEYTWGLRADSRFYWVYTHGNNLQVGPQPTTASLSARRCWLARCDTPSEVREKTYKACTVRATHLLQESLATSTWLWKCHSFPSSLVQRMGRFEPDGRQNSKRIPRIGQGQHCGNHWITSQHGVSEGCRTRVDTQVLTIHITFCSS